MTTYTRRIDMKCNGITPFIGQNRRKSDVLLCPPSFVRFLPSSVLLPLSSFLCLLSIVFLLSCAKSPVREQLERAGQVMETDSRAAAAVLDSIDSSALRSEEAALYALLKTQADYKSRIRLTSDSLPLIATRYYGTKRKGYRAALSQYYLGCAYGDMHRDLDAIDALLRATTLFPDTTNKYFAYSLFELGELYMNHQMLDEALAVFKRNRLSKACDEDSVNIGYVDFNMGLTASYKGDDALADSLLHCVIHNTKLPFSYYIPAYHQLAKLYFYHYQDVKTASELTDSLIHYKGEETGSIKLLKGDIHLAKQEVSSAFDNYQKALASNIDIYTRCSTYKGLTKAASLLGMTDSVQFYIDHYTALLDTIYGINRQEEIARIQESHVVELHDKELEARHHRFLLWVGLFGIVVLTGAVITYLLADRRRKAERLRYENALDAIRQKQVEQLAHEEEEAPDAAGKTAEASSLASLQRERIALYQQQYARSSWARHFQTHQADIREKKYMPQEDAAKFGQYLSSLFVDLQLDMLKENSTLNSPDLEYCAMILLGFKPEQISYCTRSTPKYSYNRHYRLKEKLTPDWYQLIFGKSAE